MAGANPGAFIESVVAHGEPMDPYDGEGIFYTGEDLFIEHSIDKKKKDDEEEDDVEAEEETEEESEEEDTAEAEKEQDENEEDSDEEAEESEEDKEKKKQLKHSDDEDNEEDPKKAKSVQDVIDTMNKEQQDTLYSLIGAITSNKKITVDDSDNEEEKEVKHNVFESDEQQGNYISHADFQQIMADAKRLGSLRDAVNENFEEGGVLAHSIPTDGMVGPSPSTASQTYGFRDPDMLFPEYRSTTNVPQFITGYNMSWVDRFLASVHRSPFSRIKSVFADITEDEARALGYIKGHLKKEEFFSLIKRTTDPQTIYKKQKMDRDDTIDIVDFDVIAWIRGEMRIKLNEEIARACLIGDGRLASSDDKIQESHIRPVVSDHELFVVEKEVDASDVRNIWEGAIRARKDYRGSGNMVCYLTSDVLSDMLLYTDNEGRDLFKNEQELATKMRVSKFEEVEMMANLQRGGKDVLAICMNPNDYTIGADKGGAVAMFDDFDIDYNQMKYLIETRCSGALTKPKSAIVIVAASQQGNG